MYIIFISQLNKKSFIIVFTKGKEDEDSVMCFSSSAGGVSELEQRIIKRRRTICQYDCQLWAKGLDGQKKKARALLSL